MVWSRQGGHMLETKRGVLPRILGDTKIRIECGSPQFVGIRYVDGHVVAAIFSNNIAVKEIAAADANPLLFAAYCAAHKLCVGLLGTCATVEEAVALLQAELKGVTISLETVDGNHQG